MLLNTIIISHKENIVTTARVLNTSFLPCYNNTGKYYIVYAHRAWGDHLKRTLLSSKICYSARRLHHSTREKRAERACVHETISRS
jgi:hypothetical protein